MQTNDKCKDKQIYQKLLFFVFFKGGHWKIHSLVILYAEYLKTKQKVHQKVLFFVFRAKFLSILPN